MRYKFWSKQEGLLGLVLYRGQRRPEVFRVRKQKSSRDPFVWGIWVPIEWDWEYQSAFHIDLRNGVIKEISQEEAALLLFSRAI